MDANHNVESANFMAHNRYRDNTECMINNYYSCKQVIFDI